MAAASPAIILTRTQLTHVKNLFLVNLGNRDYLLGTRKRRPGAPTLFVPILILLLGIVVAGCPAAAAAGTPGGKDTLIGLAVIVGLPCLIGIALSVRAYQRARRLDDAGQLLQGTITGVSTRERTQAATVIVWIVAIVLIIIALLDAFTTSSGASTGTPTPEAFFEVAIDYEVTTPTGKKINGRAKRNRPDLRSNGLPQEGDPMLLLYADDAQFQVM